MLIPVILSGGAGSRLWPVSREGHPKPFMKLLDGQSLLEKTYRRAASLPGIHTENGKPRVLTVTNRDYYFISKDELDKADVNGSFLLEPCSRNTAPAIAMAAHQIAHEFGPDTLMLVLAADHLISDDMAFAKAVTSAQTLASAPHNLLVTFGITPSGPETGFGYIEAGVKIDQGMRVNAFVEKPSLDIAQGYIAAGNYYWNSGMFCFSAGRFLEQLELCEPKVAEAAAACWIAMQAEKSKASSMLEIPESLFNAIPDISVDYAVMEKSTEVSVVPGNFGWSDIGSWNAIQNLMEPDENNNRSFGNAIFVNSQNTFIQSEGRMVAAVGLDNIMIIDTVDALLVANPECSQEVKKVVSALKKTGHDTFRLHKTVHRPWGSYTVLEEGAGFKMKRIEVKPGGRLSLQSHQHRSEHWIVVKGEALVINGECELIIKQNESTFIPAKHKHRLENRTQNELKIIEIQCGDYLGEDDIVRFDDVYGRVGKT